MKFTKDIYFDKRVTEDSVVNILYTGGLYKKEAKKVYIVYRFGTNKMGRKKEMTLSKNGYTVDVLVDGKYTIDFYFEDENGKIDKNRYYTSKIYPKIEEDVVTDVDFLLKEIDELDDVVDEKAKVETPPKKKIKKKTSFEKDKKRRAIIRTLCAIVFVLCVGYGIIYYRGAKAVKEETQDLLNTVTIDEIALIENDIIEDDILTDEEKRVLQVKELNKQYPELKAWIEIEGTNINYPIMQGKNNTFYMNHDYKNSYSRWGSLFLDAKYEWDPAFSNKLIYGHNFSDGMMFADLLKYKDEAFYYEHPSIRFTTPEEDAIYEIIAVFYSKVYYQDDTNVFRYYYFLNAENRDEYDEFVTNAKDASLYDIRKTALYNEELLTLSTCDYSQKDGRFVVVARKKY